MNQFEQIKKGIYRLKIPFGQIWTSVFLLQNENGHILLDTATTEYDVTHYIIPALDRIRIAPDYILYSHHHDDHAGGFEALVKQYPHSITNQTLDIKDGKVLLEQFEILELKGHTLDCIGILDRKNAVLLSCDGLQQRGVGKYKASFEDRTAYHQTIQKLRQREIQTVICSHDYEPFGDIIEGKANILPLYDFCDHASNVLSHT